MGVRSRHEPARAGEGRRGPARSPRSTRSTRSTRSARAVERSSAPGISTQLTSRGPPQIIGKAVADKNGTHFWVGMGIVVGGKGGKGLADQNGGTCSGQLTNILWTKWVGCAKS